MAQELLALVRKNRQSSNEKVLEKEAIGDVPQDSTPPLPETSLGIFSEGAAGMRVTSSLDAQGRDKRQRVDSEVIIDIPDDPVRQGSGEVFIPKWKVMATDTMFANEEKHRYLSKELFRAFDLPADHSRYEDFSADYSLAMSASLFAKGCAWFNHALERQTVEAKKLEDACHQITSLMEQLKETREEALKERRLREEATQDLVQIKKTCEEAKTEVARLKEVEADLLKQAEQSQQEQVALKKKFDEELLDAELRLVTSGYNEAVCLAKKKGFDYKTLLLNPEKDVTLEISDDVEVEEDSRGVDDTDAEVESDKTK